MASPLRSQSPEYDLDPASKRKRKPETNEQLNPKSKRKRGKRTSTVELPGNGTNMMIEYMGSSLLADHIAQRTRKFETTLSPIELEDRYISEKLIDDTTSWTRARSLVGLPDFLRHFTLIKTQLTATPKIKGAPHTIFVTSSGLRSADLTRVLRVYQTKEAAVAKLFAKHIKLKDAIEYVRSTNIGIAVGTPQRLLDLSKEGALNLSLVQRIVVDCSHIDTKNRSILDMRETQVPLVTFLNSDALKPRYGNKDGNGTSLLFY